MPVSILPKPFASPSSLEQEDLTHPHSDDYWDNQETFALEEIDQLETLALQSAQPCECTHGSITSILIEIQQSHLLPCLLRYTQQ